MKPLPEPIQLGDMKAVPYQMRHSAQVNWDVRMGARMLGTLDGATEWQVQQLLRLLHNARTNQAGDTRSEIRDALGITGPGR